MKSLYLCAGRFALFTAVIGATAGPGLPWSGLARGAEPAKAQPLQRRCPR